MACVEAEFFDVALKMVTDHPELATRKSLLRVLAQKPNACQAIVLPHRRLINTYLSTYGVEFRLLEEKTSPAIQLLRIIWTNILKLPKTEVEDIVKGSTGVLFVAANLGNNAFVVELIRGHPGLVWEVNDDNQSIFHIAVLHRHGSLYKLVYERGMFKESIMNLEDKNGNNMLHLVGMLGDRAKDNITCIPGVVLQMQRELLWFKEVEAILPTHFQEKINAEGLTPREVFTKNHKYLVSKGEAWLKDTAAQLMVVAALIATITFAAAITFPGGYNEQTGNPFFLKKESFSYFLLSNALSFMFGSTSILLLLSILTSRYVEGDFMKVLPNKLLLVLATLFFSISTMFMAFGYNFFVLYDKNPKRIPIIVAVLVYGTYVLAGAVTLPLMGQIYNYLIKAKFSPFFTSSPSTSISPLPSLSTTQNQIQLFLKSRSKRFD